jgi:dihydroorotase
MTQRLFQADAAPASVVIAGGRLVDPAAGFHGEAADLRIENGRIVEIGRDLHHPDAETIDAAGLTVMPGLVDPHVHLRTPGDEDEEDIASGTRAAAAGGFVAILAMPNTSPIVDSAAVLTGLIDAARTDAVVATGFMCAITAGQQGRRLSEMGELAAAGAAAFSDDGRPVADAGILRRALQYSSITGLKLALHEEDTSLSAGGQMHEGVVSAELGLRGWPSVAESTMIGRDVGLARHEGAPLHICHVSVADSVAEIRRAREWGAQVSAEVTPHHLCLTDEAVRALDPAVSKMNPPLASAADRAALIDALADGTLDCIATDHAPHHDYEKDAPFEEAPFGVIGLETAFAAVYTHLVEPGLLTLQTVIERMSSGPAAAFGLPVPMLAVGHRADLTVWDLGSTRRVEPPYASRSTNCAFAGQTLRGVCRLTVSGGRVAHRLIEAVA